MRRRARRGVARIEIGLALTLGRIGQELQHDAAGAPMPSRAMFAGAEFFGDREPDPRWDLLRTQEIFMRGLFEAAAFERHKPLITAHFAALVDGHGEMAAAEQLARLDLAVGDC